MRTSLAGWEPTSSGTSRVAPFCLCYWEISGSFWNLEVSILSMSECSPAFAKVPFSCLGHMSNVSMPKWR